MSTVRLTMAQALVRFLAAQTTERDGLTVPLFAGMWAIFGHGNVTGLGEALQAAGEALPTFRAHNEQAMAHAAIAYAKATRRRQLMACTTSIGPGATNMVTAAALAHVNRLPVLLLPGDVFASRRPDPVLQQVECFADATVSANDCFRPVSRYFDRITRPEQLLTSLPRALAVLTDPAACGPATLALCQDVQTEAFDYPATFFAPRIWRARRQAPDEHELAEAASLLQAAKTPLIVAGGGVAYADAADALTAFAEAHDIPIVETQAGKGAITHDHPLNLGAVGVTGTAAANGLAAEADVILAVGTRLQDFTTGSRSLFARAGRRIISLNVQPYDAGKHEALPLVGDALRGIEALAAALASVRAARLHPLTPAEAGVQRAGGSRLSPGRAEGGFLRVETAPGTPLGRPAWRARAVAAKARWLEEAAKAVAATNAARPSDAQVIGAVQRAGRPGDVVVCAAGGLPGELHKLWQVGEPGGYHLEYGYSCMGYEIAGGLGAKMAMPDREVVVMVGDGSYLMMNSEIATSVMLGQKLIIVLLDNSGFGCIDRLQRASGGLPFNNLLADARHARLPSIDFRAHAQSLGAAAERVGGLADLEGALERARASDRTAVVVIETDPAVSTAAGGHWWDVPIAETSDRAEIRAAREAYEDALAGLADAR